MDAKSITERDQKINFLGKMIALVEIMTQEKMEVKPAKIVAGLEPENTNEFLQTLFQVATSGVDSMPFVKQILGIEEEDDGGAGEEQARQEQLRLEEEEKAKQAQKQKKSGEEGKKKQAEDKKKADALAKKQQEEEEDRKRKEQEALKLKQA